MGSTVVSSANPATVKLWSAALQVAAQKQSYFNKKFVGKAQSMDMDSGFVIHEMDELGSAQGDKITFHLATALRNKPTRGDDNFVGNQEAMTLHTDAVYIDQLRHGPDLGGKMTRKRTMVDMRKLGNRLLSEYFAQYMDELFFIYLSGARGVNAGFIEDTNFTGHAGNALSAPDSYHIVYGGDATGKADLDTADKMTTALIDRLVTKAKTMGNNPDVPRIKPVKVEGNNNYVLLMHPRQEYDLRTATATGSWLDIQKAAAGAEGKANQIFKGSLGMYNNVILHEHESVIEFNDYGAGGNVEAARALFMGEQAGVVAYGVPDTGTQKGARYEWYEETFDAGNKTLIVGSTIVGVKKTTYKKGATSYDFGVIAVDTAAADPN